MSTGQYLHRIGRVLIFLRQQFTPLTYLFILIILVLGVRQHFWEENKILKLLSNVLSLNYLTPLGLCKIIQPCCPLTSLLSARLLSFLLTTINTLLTPHSSTFGILNSQSQSLSPTYLDWQTFHWALLYVL